MKKSVEDYYDGIITALHEMVKDLRKEIDSKDTQIQTLSETVMDIAYAGFFAPYAIQGMASRMKGNHNYGKTAEQCHANVMNDKSESLSLFIDCFI